MLKKGDHAIAIVNRRYREIRVMKIKTDTLNKAGQPIKPKTFYYVCLCDKNKYMWLPKNRVVPKQPRTLRPPIRQHKTRRARQNLIVPHSKKYSSAHITWCIVCGGVDGIQQCDTCPASYHPNCEGVWIFRMKCHDNKDKNSTEMNQIIEDLLVVHSSKTCPSCIYGPAFTYGDIVWNKNGTFPWWPAKILKPGNIPLCLLRNCNTIGEWPIKYYSNDSWNPCCRPQSTGSTSNEENIYSWVSASSICLFHPDHYHASKNICKNRDDAIDEACHDFIVTYLI